MSLLDSMLARFGYVKAGKPPPSDYVTTWDIPQQETILAQADVYRMSSWVQIAVQALCREATMAAFHVKKRTGEDDEEIIAHPFERLLEKPNPYQSKSEFIEGTISFYAVTGNAYWWLNRTRPSGEPLELWLIPPQNLTPVPDGRRGVKGYIYRDDNGLNVRPYETWEITHFKTFNPRMPYIGQSFVDALKDTIVGDLAMQRWNKNYFDRDNAKMSGILAFADPIIDSEWEKMKASIKEQQGGTQRRMMMLRDVKKGGVEWITTTLSQKDMEFLQARNFNKEEIWNTIAPGLAPLLSINATEANSKTARSTFLSAVYSILCRLSEKITQTLLPAYGDNLTAHFEDIRPVDRALKLAEQEAFSKVHTVDEIRMEYYGDKPIGDERGELTLVELAKYVEKEETPPMDAAMLERLQQPPTMPPMTDEPMAKDEKPDMAEMETHDESEEGTYKAAFLDELSKWRGFYLSRYKAGKAPNREFETTVIDPTLKASMLQALASCDSVEGVKRVFADAKHWIHG